MATSANELGKGARFELLEPAGYHEPGEQGTVVHACPTTALVNFDHADPYGARQRVVDRAILRPLAIRRGTPDE